MTEQSITRALAQDIHTTEEALDDALGLMGGFFSRLIQARRNANLSATIGHEVYESVNEGASYIVKARRHLLDAHRRLEVISRKLGFDDDITPIDKPANLVALPQAVLAGDGA